MEKKTLIKETPAPSSFLEKNLSSSGKSDWQKQKEETALKRKKENLMKKAEKQIEETEEKILLLDKLLEKEDVYTNAQKSREICEEKNNLEEKLLQIYSEWENLTSE